MLTICCGAVELSSTVQLHNNYEILWKLWMTKHFVPVYRCTVSLGNDDDNPFADMYDELDGMVLDCYNATSMDIGTEANLFRSVPSSPELAADTNYYTLDVRYTPTFYVASSRSYNTSMCLANAICLHDIYDARCVQCKGKKADGSEL